MGKISFEILGRPQGKGRPRFARRGKFVTTYTPQKTADYEELVRQSFLTQLGNQPRIDEDVEEVNLSAKIIAHFKPNKTETKKRAKYLVENKIGFNKKPDCDNIAKIILDALNGIAFKDDNSVTELEVIKIYDEEDKVEVEIKIID